MMATWLAADCGSQFCMAVACWCETSSETTALVRWAACRFFLDSGGMTRWFCMESS